MGYNTEFKGSFNLDRPLTKEHLEYLMKFSKTRRVLRNGNKVKNIADPLRKAVNLPCGLQGGYFVGGSGFYGQDEDESIIDFNRPPKGQPSVWCKWIPSEDGTSIIWDGREKFYEYVLWLFYLMEQFLAEWGYTLNGTMYYQSEEPGDVGKIKIVDNFLEVIDLSTFA